VTLALLASGQLVHAQAPQVGDITVGMSPAEIEPIVRKRGLKLLPVQKVEISFTLPNGQQAVLPNSLHIPGLTYSQFSSNRTGENLIVHLSPYGGREKAVIIDRNQDLGVAKTNPTPDEVLQGLEKRYGKPTHHYPETASRHTLKWIWDADGKLQPQR